MSVLNIDTIHAITESVGVTLKENVALALLADVEYRLREVVHPLYGFTSSSAFRFKQVPQGLQRLYYLDDNEVDLDDIIYGPLPPVPLDMSYTSHWLAIDGVQPAIVQNPTPAESKAISDASQQRTGSGGISIGGMAGSRGGDDGSGSSFANRPPGTVNGEPLVKHVLSKELQMYYDKVTECILSPADELKNLAVESLAKDPGIQPLLPYFIQFTTDKLHQLLPNIITCIVSKKLGDGTENHFPLRSFAASLAAYICQRYGLIYPSLEPRVTKTLLKAFLDPTKSLATHYGAVKGLVAISVEAFKALIVPNLKVYGAISMAQARDPASGAFKSQDAANVHHAILDALKVLFIKERDLDRTVDVSENGLFSEAQLGVFFDDFKNIVRQLPPPRQPGQPASGATGPRPPAAGGGAGPAPGGARGPPPGAGGSAGTGSGSGVNGGRPSPMMIG
ncbi:hypothetical protein HDU96_009386 [Phlyctochytrium bullatum]|nr:hypothetical protein HDU96_009386 [Phlyctochytrium bullatum]